MIVRFSPFAEQDLDLSINWYNQEKEGLGYELLIEISKAIDRIKQNPKQFPKTYKKYRKININRFPFNVFYIEKEGTLSTFSTIYITFKKFLN